MTCSTLGQGQNLKDPVVKVDSQHVNINRSPAPGAQSPPPPPPPYVIPAGNGLLLDAMGYSFEPWQASPTIPGEIQLIQMTPSGELDRRSAFKTPWRKGIQQYRLDTKTLRPIVVQSGNVTFSGFQKGQRWHIVITRKDSFAALWASEIHVP